jgi:hypothetical protein
LAASSQICWHAGAARTLASTAGADEDRARAAALRA